MLVLNRKPGEAIKIAEHIEVVVLSIKGGKVKLGIVAPDGVRVLRTEIIDRDEESKVA